MFPVRLWHSKPYAEVYRGILIVFVYTLPRMRGGVHRNEWQLLAPFPQTPGLNSAFNFAIFQYFGFLFSTQMSFPSFPLLVVGEE